MKKQQNNKEEQPKNNKIEEREIVKEMKSSYIDYAMSVIVTRALPDVRDGLKPVHRRILFSMLEEGLRHNAKFRKSAAVVGTTLARYHPHGDMSVYDALVRMAQDFSLRYPLVQGQGNFGCFTKDTKVRLSDGRSLSFEELIKEQKEGKKHWTFAFNHESKKIEIAEVKKPRLTKKNEQIMEVALDNGEKVKCTLDHLFMLRDGSYKEAKNLKPNDSLMPLYTKLYNGKKATSENNSIPNFSEILTETKKRNHKVVETKILEKREDVYDLTVEQWHNFALGAGIFVHNSIDNDPAAAQRYTECKMSRMGEEMLKNIEKSTVNFIYNYDGTRKEPAVLPSPLPQLVLNGSLGIAVGMATNIPPHNLGEICDALIHLADNPNSTTEDLFKFIKGPDFPTGGIIFGKKDIVSAYSQGKGPIVIRGKAEIKEDKTGKSQIIISEIPYQTHKSTLVEQFAKLVKDKKVIGVKDIRDESDKEGMRIAFDLQRDSFPQKILNKLYKFTDLQKTFHLNMLALVDGIQPKVLSMSDVLSYFVTHRKEVITRRTKHELEKAKERAHVLEGLHKCLSKIDAVIKTIKESQNREDALKNLMKKFKLSEIQANAILETKLSALAKLERKKIEDELKELEKRIKELASILKSPKKIKDIFVKETLELKERFGDDRKTKVSAQRVGEIAEEDLIPHEETIITLTKGGYIKRINPNTYKLQKRGGKGILGMKTMQDDIVEHFLLAETHDSLLFFTDSGKVFKTTAYEIPEGTRVARGRGLLNFIDISPHDKVLSIMAIGKEESKAGIKNLLMATEKGIIKKVELEKFKNVRKTGLIAIKLKKDDLLRKVLKTTGEDEIILVTKKGQSVKFKEDSLREMGRSASGVKGIELKKEDKVVGGCAVSRKNGEKDDYLLVLTEKGFGKRTNTKEYRLQKRGGSGIKAGNVSSKTGDLVAAEALYGDEEDLIVISRKGHIIRTKISSIPKLSRTTQGVRTMRLEPGNGAVSIICV